MNKLARLTPIILFTLIVTVFAGCGGSGSSGGGSVIHNYTLIVPN